MAAPQITDVYPASAATGIPIASPIEVTFDQEMDTSSITNGTFFLIAPDTGVAFGDDLNPFEEPGLQDEDLLTFPYFSGYVKGSITFEKVNASGGIVDTEDTSGAGNLWLTKAIFTPEVALNPNSEYKVVVSGDENTADAFDTGVRSRSVFDPSEVSVSGTGSITMDGSFTGTSQQVYHVKITTGGTTGTAEYEWWKESDPLTVYTGITSTGPRELENGVILTCSSDGTFTVNDEWSIICKPYEALENNYRWTFTTSSGSIATPPSSSSASGIDSLTDAGSTTTVSSDALTVSEISPEDRKYGIALDTTTITITMGANIDATTLTSNITITALPANGDEDQFSATGALTFSTSVTSNVLTITLDADQLENNNIVEIVLDKDIADTDGNTIGEDLTYFFTTPYTPLYSSERLVRIELGNLISDVPEETVMLAILEASLMADALNFNTSVSNSTFFKQARKQYVTCKASLTLLNAIASDPSMSDSMYKTLGDFAVSRKGLRASLNDQFNRLQDCVEAWEIAVKTGGDVTPGASVKPGYSIKGVYSNDSITVSRQWELTEGDSDDPYYENTPSANTRVGRLGRSSRRRLRTNRTKRHR